MNKNTAKNNSKKAVVLFSGGLDSSTVLKIALDEGYDVIPVSFFYNQRHGTEIDHAKKIAEYFNIKNHIVINLDFSGIKGSALVDFNICVPKNQIKIHNGSDFNSATGNLEKSKLFAQRDDISATRKDNIPITYVPARNTIFLSYAIAVGEVNNAGDIFIGVNWIDYSGYPDCRPEYIQAFEQMANLATKVSVTGALKFKIHTPLINMGKKDIIKKADEIGVPLKMTHSCYDPVDGLACGVCDSCILRRNGFIEAGIEDPTVYAKLF
jgi:7-cyano-7-deazaguanine synthase